MNHAIKLAIPIGLGVVAGALNFVAVRPDPQTSYVTAKTAIAAGSALGNDSSDFGKTGVPDDVKIPGAVRSEDVAVFFGRISPRDVEPGELLFFSDISTAPAGLKLELGQVAVNISLEDVRFESHLLKVGRRVGFAVRQGALAGSAQNEEPAGEAGRQESRYEVLGPFTILSVGGRTSRFGDDSSQTGIASTISVACELPESSSGLSPKDSRLIEVNRNKMIAAVVIYPDEAKKAGP